ncbi:MAG: Ig-like domain-containing protein, partial [Candidatus Saliniplasma sp.]
DVDYVMDMSSYVTDPDNSLEELTFFTDSSYADVEGHLITFNYPDGVDNETVTIRVEDLAGAYDEAVVDVTVNAVNEPPEFSGVPSEIECIEEEDYVLDMSSYVTDPDNGLEELTFSTDSSYAEVDGYNITFNYYGGITEEEVTITVEDPEGLSDSVVIDASVTLVWEYPSVVTSGPSGVDVTFDENIVVEFSMSMDTAAVESAFSLMKDGDEVQGTFSWNSDNTQMTFDPDDDLTEGDYTVILTTDASSNEGTNLLEDHTWDFSVSGDDSGTGFPIWWLAFGILLLVILLLVAFFVMRRSSKEEQYPEYQEEDIDAVVEPRWHDMDVPPEEPWVQQEPPVDGEEVPEGDVEEEPGQ